MKTWQLNTKKKKEEEEEAAAAAAAAAVAKKKEEEEAAAAAAAAAAEVEKEEEEEAPGQGESNAGKAGYKRCAKCKEWKPKYDVFQLLVIFVPSFRLVCKFFVP